MIEEKGEKKKQTNPEPIWQPAKAPRHGITDIYHTARDCPIHSNVGIANT